MAGNSHIKETQAAKRFANENDIYGIRFLARYKEWHIFGVTYPPGLVVDPAWPPIYVIVEKGLSVRWSEEDEGEVIYHYLESIHAPNYF